MPDRSSPTRSRPSSLDVTGPHRPALRPSLSGGPGPSPFDLTGPHPQVEAAPRQPRIRDLIPGPGPEAAPPDGEEEGASGDQARLATRVVSLDPEAQRGTRIVEISLPKIVKKAARERASEPSPSSSSAQRSGRKGALSLDESGVSRGLDETLATLKLFYARLGAMDRAALWLLCAVFLASFLPWLRVPSYGLTAGIQDYGLLTAPLAVLTVLCIYARTMRRRLTFVFLLLQLLGAAALVAVIVYRYISGVDLEFTYGIYLTVLLAALAVLATLARLARFNT